MHRSGLSHAGVKAWKNNALNRTVTVPQRLVTIYKPTYKSVLPHSPYALGRHRDNARIKPRPGLNNKS